MKGRRALLSFAAFAVGIGLLVWLAHDMDISAQALMQIAERLNLRAFGGIILCSLLYTLLGAAKWRLISAHSGAPKTPPFFYTHYTALAMLLGQFLPQPVATASSRAAVMRVAQKIPVRHGLLNAVYDLGFDFLIALLLVPVSLRQLMNGSGLHVWIAESVLTVIGAGLILTALAKLLPRGLKARLAGTDGKTPLDASLTAWLVFLSALRFTLVIIRLLLGIRAAWLFIPFSAAIYATPLATLPSLLPLTPASLGIAEWSWSYLLTLWQVPAALGALYAVSFRILVLAAQALVSLLAAMLYMAGRWYSRRRAVNIGNV